MTDDEIEACLEDIQRFKEAVERARKVEEIDSKIRDLEQLKAFKEAMGRTRGFLSYRCAQVALEWALKRVPCAPPEQCAEYREGLEVQMAVLTRRLESQETAYEDWLADVNGILNPYGLTVDIGGDTERALRAGPGPLVS